MKVATFQKTKVATFLFLQTKTKPKNSEENKPAQFTVTKNTQQLPKNTADTLICSA
jgi:hypothetical protein